MDNFHNPYPQIPFSIVQNDEFLDLLNDSSQHPYQQTDIKCQNICYGEEYDFQGLFRQNDLKGSRQEKQWMFGPNQFEMKFEESPPENNPFYESHPQIVPLSIKRECRSDSYFGNQLLELAPQYQTMQPQCDSHTANQNLQKKEQEIILNNKELFKANQSKSIYLSKISTLIDRNVSPNQGNNLQPVQSPLSPNANYKIQEKILRKTSNGKQDSESSSDMRGDPMEQKLAKNRESARNSRKRKKVYVELLENKVCELTEQLQKLESLCNSQKQIINMLSPVSDERQLLSMNSVTQQQQCQKIENFIEREIAIKIEDNGENNTQRKKQVKTLS